MNQLSPWPRRLAPLLLLALCSFGPGLFGATPVPVIFDTDMSTDCDDVGALAVLHKFADNGEAKILACVANARDHDKAIAASIDAINTYYGRPGLPIGTYQGQAMGVVGSPYTAHLRDEFLHTAKPDDQEPLAVDVYRSALAAADDGSVVIVSVGYLINLEDLLKSNPDVHSPLSGMELVRKKVKKLVVMGGSYPSNGGENNFAGNGGGPHTQYVITQWPTPMLFSGAEIGAGITTGKGLATLPKSDPVRRAYEIYTHFGGRPSWDLTAALAAVRDPALYWDEVSDGYCQVENSGANAWVTGTARGQAYLVTKKTPYDVGSLLDDILGTAPGVRLDR